MSRPERLPRGLTPGGRFAGWAPDGLRYVALDVDGTLVREAPTPGAEVLRAVGRLVERGVRVGLATGRTGSATQGLLATGAFTGPHVFHNGAVVADADGSARMVHGLSGEEVDALLGLGGRRDDLSIEVYVEDSYLSDRDDPRSRPHAELLGIAPSGRIASAADLAGRAAIKAVMVCFTPEAGDAMSEEVVRLGLAAGPASSPATPTLRYINVTRSGVDKGSGVEAAARSLGLDLRSVAALGDETNDLPALLRAGTAIAMGGSAAAVVSAAHLVAPNFSADGAAVALEGLLALAPG